MCQSEDAHQIVMSFSPPVEGCLLKKGSCKVGSRAPQVPLATLLVARLRLKLNSQMALKN